MFTLFYDDCDEQLAVFGQKREALAMAERLSRETGRSIVMLFSKAPGESTFCCKFESGERLHDAKCCPDDYGSARLG